MYDLIVAHGINTLWVVIDICIIAMPIRALHFYLPVLFAISYIVFSVAYDYAGGTNYYKDSYIYSVSSLTSTRLNQTKFNFKHEPYDWTIKSVTYAHHHNA
jgi:hypothetical protein